MSGPETDSKEREMTVKRRRKSEVADQAGTRLGNQKRKLM